MKSKNRKPAAEQPAEVRVEATPSGDGAVGEAPAPAEVPAAEEEATARQVLENPEQAVLRLEGQLAEMQDRHLRIAAEYDNFRKRTARERTELWTRAQADVVAGILDVLDDFGRVLDVDQSQATTEDVIKGVALVERKLIRDLEAAGLERVGDVGEPFDPNQHEALGSLPAESEDHDQTVGAVLQLGYKFGGALLRPARVQVRMWQDDGGAAG
jgi:molecular chaperone GrpE